MICLYLSSIVNHLIGLAFIKFINLFFIQEAAYVRAINILICNRSCWQAKPLSIHPLSMDFISDAKNLTLQAVTCIAKYKMLLINISPSKLWFIIMVYRSGIINCIPNLCHWFNFSCIHAYINSICRIERQWALCITNDLCQ